MSAAGWCSAVLLGLSGLVVSAARAESPMHHKVPVRLLSTVHASYRLVQQGEKIGMESIDRRTYDNNTVTYDMAGTARLAGALFSKNSNLVLDEESYFPRSFRSDQTILRQEDTTSISFTVDMFSNVAVVGSEMRGRTDSRRLVVPVGIPIVEVGAVYSWYEILFWVDSTSRERQRIQWLDPQRGVVEDGEIFFSGEQTIDVLGKKTPVTVFKAERERLGAAALYVDAAGRIVRCEQNVTVFELVEWTEK